MTLALRYAVRSDVGLLREGNEDSAYAGPHLLAVADGMGGHAAGEVASAAAITTMAALDVDQPTPDLLPALAHAVANANMRLQEMIMADPATEGMGTTLTALLWSDGHAALCHIGDSRAYLLRDGKFYQITHDHTLVQSLVDDGRITEDDVATHPQRSLLLRALDGRTLADPDLSTHETMLGDRYLLCSDGLSGVVTEQTLHQALSSVRDPDKAALQLVELALKGGGPDNITCIVADVVDPQTTMAPLTWTPILAGAAQAGPPQQLRSAVRQNSPAARAGRLRKTEPQVALPADDDPRWAGDDDGDYDDRDDVTYRGAAAPRAGGPYRRPGAEAAQSPARGRHGRRAGPGDDDDDWSRANHSGRRRWPIVTTLLVVLVLALGGAGFAGWQYLQSQYYIGVAADGNVVVYQGVNTSLLGLSLSSTYQNTGLPLAQLSLPDQTAIRATIAFSGVPVRSVSALRTQATQCRGAWNQLAAWQGLEAAYQVAFSRWAHLTPKLKSQQKQPAPPGPQPAAPTSGNCGPASAFGVTAAQLPAGTPNTTPGTANAAAPLPTATATATPSATARASASPSSKASSTSGPRSSTPAPSSSTRA